METAAASVLGKLMRLPSTGEVEGVREGLLAVQNVELTVFAEQMKTGKMFG